MVETIKQVLKSESGVSSIEFALVSVPLLLLILGIIEFGLALQIKNEVERSLDIAAREFEVNGFGDPFFTNSESCDEIKATLKDRLETEIKEISRSTLINNPDKISVTIQCVQTPLIQVEAVYEYTLSIPFFDLNMVNLSTSRVIRGPWQYV
jgi:Flp pilus assembly pilin Flp